MLADSNITEATGAIGINGTPNTNFRLDVNGSVLFRGSNPGFNLVGLRPAGNQWVFQTVDDDGRFRLFSQDNSNPGVERLTIGLSTGNVGIGTNNPTGPLHVVASINSVANAPIISGAIDNVLLVLSSTNPGGRKWFLDSAAGGSFYGAGNLAIGNGSSFPATPTMVLTPNSNVGIGTTTPTLAKLQVVSSTGDGVYAQGFSFGTGISGHTISGSGVNGVADNGVGVQGNSNSGYGVYGDSDGTGVYGHSNNGYGVRGQSTNGNGVYGYSQNSFAGYFDGTVRVASIPAGSHVGTVCFNPAGDLLYCEGSSLRFKINVRPFRAGLDIIRRLRPISFNWKEDGKPDIG
ncbi:MAG TPA: tail fiber domain-containing protein, partial [Candidatus Dormibacteraeota bacterium]|nr:tail fiber domain-containing protein [Candidatus Dormibacteraeota bacterium]